MEKLTPTPLGSRYTYYHKFDNKSIKYDYEHNGLLNKLMSHTIIESENHALKGILSVVEYSLVFISKYIDSLKDFKNFTKKNR